MLASLERDRSFPLYNVAVYFLIQGLFGCSVAWPILDTISLRTSLNTTVVLAFFWLVGLLRLPHRPKRWGSASTLLQLGRVGVPLPNRGWDEVWCRLTSICDLGVTRLHSVSRSV